LNKEKGMAFTMFRLLSYTTQPDQKDELMRILNEDLANWLGDKDPVIATQKRALAQFFTGEVGGMFKATVLVPITRETDLIQWQPALFRALKEDMIVRPEPVP
jgi:hypothetical protein